MSLKKKFKKVSDKVRDRYCGGKSCDRCHYKNNKTCLNSLLCDAYTMICDGEKEDEKEN